MEEKFTAKTAFNLKSRIDMVRVFMGRVYYTFLLVEGAVICFNCYLITGGKAAPGDAKKTVSLFVLMIIWAFIPVAAGLIWDKVSKVKTQIISVLENKIIVTNDTKTFELTPKRFYTIIEMENYIKLGPLKETVIINKNDVTFGDGDKLADFLRNMKS